jgi:hypothetical protein
MVSLWKCVLRDVSPSPLLIVIPLEYSLNVAADDVSQRPDQLVNLTRGGNANCVRNTDSVASRLLHMGLERPRGSISYLERGWTYVDGLVQAEQVDNVGSERVFGGESDFDALAVERVSFTFF